MTRRNEKYGEQKVNSIVSHSACLIAASRALETERTDALIEDPLAHLLAGDVMMEERRNMYGDAKTKDTTYRIAIRTKYFDDFICNQIMKNSLLTPNNSNTEEATTTKYQVVLLGAGMDSRSFRLNLGELLDQHVMFYEIDNSEVLDLKESRLRNSLLSSSPLEVKNLIHKGNERRKAIRCNILEDTWTALLLKAGYNSNIPTCWVLEGLTYYFPKSDSTVSNIFSKVRQLSCSKSCMIASIATIASVQRASNSKNDLMRQWRWGHDEPHLFLSSKKCGAWICEFDRHVVYLGKDERTNFNSRYPSTSENREGEKEGNKKYGIMYVTAFCEACE